MHACLSTYEAEIQQLYVNDNETAKATIYTINRKHGTAFTQRQFKSRYGGRKNLQAHEWKAIISKLRSQVAEAKQFQIYINGRQLQEKRVKQAFMRYEKKIGDEKFDDVDIGIDTTNEHRIEVRTLGFGTTNDKVLVDLDSGYEASTISTEAASVDLHHAPVVSPSLVGSVYEVPSFNFDPIDPLSLPRSSLELCIDLQIDEPNVSQPAPTNSFLASHPSLWMWNDNNSHQNEIPQATRDIRIPSPRLLTPSSFNVLHLDDKPFWDLPEIRELFPALQHANKFPTPDAQGPHSQINQHMAAECHKGWISSYLNSISPKLAALSETAARVQLLVDQRPGDRHHAVLSVKDHCQTSLFQMFSLVAYLISNGKLSDFQITEFLGWVVNEEFLDSLCKFVQTSSLALFILHNVLRMLPNLYLPDKSNGNMRSQRNLFETHPEECYKMISKADQRLYSHSLVSSLLVRAAEANNLPAVQFLVAQRKCLQGCSYKSLNAYPPSPLVRAAEVGLDGVVQLLVGSKANNPDELSDALGMAMSHRNAGTTRILLNASDRIRLDIIIDDMPILQWTNQFDQNLCQILNKKAAPIERMQASLTRAAEMGPRALSKALLRYETFRDDTLEGALCFAIRCGRVGAVRTLLSRKVDVEAAKYRSKHPCKDTLLLALGFKSNFSNYKKNKEMAYLLNQAGKQLPPLEALLDFQHPLVPSIWAILAEVGFDITVLGPYALAEQASCVSRDSSSGIFECGWFLDRGAPIDGYAPAIDRYRVFTNGHGIGCLSALQTAAYNGNLDLVLYLIERGANVNLPASNNGGLTALQAAALSGNPVLVDCLLDEGANCNAIPAGSNGYTALEAVANAHWHHNSPDASLTIFKRLLSAGARLNRPDGAGKLLAGLILNELWGCLELALSSEARPEGIAAVNMNRWNHDEPGFYGTPLQVAAYSKNLEAVRLLLKYGAAVNDPACNFRGYTALQAVSATNERPKQGSHADEQFEKQTEIVRLLVLRGADVNAPAGDEFGRTALQAAAEAEEPNINLIHYLLAKQADVNAPPARVGGVTALQGAASRGNMDLARSLLHAKANANAPAAQEKGRTAIEGAAEHGRMEMLKLLLDNGARADPMQGFSTAIKLANENHHWHIADFLDKLDTRLWSRPFAIHRTISPT